MTYYDEAAFFEAWRAGVVLAGEQYFGNGTHSPATASSKWDLAPGLERINHDIGVLSSGEATFLAALVSFYDGAAGADLQRHAEARGLSDVATRLDHVRRQVLADLLIAYPGW
ncbi:hypothetical protein [Mycolicibacterium porcinum]|uniref:Aminoglycoside phosphotransferase n=1 Tax=Mycolicibacterium porcinum TaxID=39693 RepID=A0ABV3VN44_9MYCO